jgi:hypothetical protein
MAPMKSHLALESHEAATAAIKGPRKESYMTIRGGITRVEVTKSSAMKPGTSSREKDLLNLSNNSAKEPEGDAPTAQALQLRAPSLRSGSKTKSGRKVALAAAGLANGVLGGVDGSPGEALHPGYYKCGREGSPMQRLVGRTKEIGTESVVNATVACAAGSTAHMATVQNGGPGKSDELQTSDLAAGSAKPTNDKVPPSSTAAGTVTSSKTQAADGGVKFPEETSVDIEQGGYNSGAFGSELDKAPEMELEVSEEPRQGSNTSTQRTSRNKETQTKESLEVHPSAVQVERAPEKVLKLPEGAPSRGAAPSGRNVEGRVSGSIDFGFINPVEDVNATVHVSSEKRAGSNAGILLRSPEVRRTPCTGPNLQGGDERGSGPVVHSFAVPALLQRHCAQGAEDPTSEVRVAGVYGKTSTPRTDPSTSVANQIPPVGGQSFVTPVLVVPSATTCSDTRVMVTDSTNIEGEKSNEDVVREQLEAMLQRLPIEERSKWLVEAAQMRFQLYLPCIVSFIFLKCTWEFC